jgi:uncharacterized membrane protein YhaH (DUF805 family)
MEPLQTAARMSDLNTNPYKPPETSLIVDADPNGEPYTRELYNKLLTFKGRMGRIRFLYTTVGGTAMALIMVLFWSNLHVILLVPAGIYYTVKMPWVFAASTVRRTQDLGKPNNWAWFALLPPYFIWLALASGQDTSNEYGDIVFKPTRWEYVGVFSTLFFGSIFILLFTSGYLFS